MTQTPTHEMPWKVDLPEGKRGRVEIRKFTIEENSLGNMLLGMRASRAGEYTALFRDGRLWMSDTDAEQRDHWKADWQIRISGGRILVMGLGLGMIVHRALQYEHVEHVDVVEIDPDVAELVGQHYAGPRCTVHVADAYEIKWPRGTRWSYAWHDIWPDLCEDNLPEMARLARSYGRRVDQQGFWGKELLLQERRRTADAWWRR
jgi:hypothetical protein